MPVSSQGCLIDCSTSCALRTGNIVVDTTGSSSVLRYEPIMHRKQNVSLTKFFHIPQLLLMVGMIDGPVRASTSSPLLPSITSIGPASTPLAPDVTEPPAITSQPPEVQHVLQPHFFSICSRVLFFVAVGVNGGNGGRLWRGRRSESIRESSQQTECLSQ